MAIPVWNKLRNNEDVSLERALGAFDMFVLEDGPGDFNDVRGMIPRCTHALIRIRGSN